MTFNIAVNTTFGPFTKAQFKRGDIPTPGTRATAASASDGGVTKEYISVKFTATGTRINGQLVSLDGRSVATEGSAATDATALLAGKRAGILAFASVPGTASSGTVAAATITMSGTHFAWAQIWGPAKGYITGTVTASLESLVEPGSGGAFDEGAIASTSLNLQGANFILTAGGTASFTGPGLADIFLNYPKFVDIGD